MMNIRLNRRHFLITAGAVTATGLLAACGDDGESDDTSVDSDTGTDEDQVVEDDSDETPDADDGEDTDAGDDEPEESSGDETSAGDGGELIYGLSSDPPNLDPHIYTGGASAVPKFLVYNGLVRYWAEDGNDVEIEPDLAEDVSISDDGLEYTFTLREGVTFHNGSPFTSADVKTSLERIQDEELGASNAGRLESVIDIEAPDDFTVVLTLSNPVAPMMGYLANSSSTIISHEFLESGGDPDQEMIGTGAFVFEAFEPGARLDLVKNEDYFREGLPYLDRVRLVPYPDEGTRMTALYGGDIHITELVPWREFDRIREDPDVTLHTSDGSSFMYIVYNCEEEPFNDPAVRRALNFAYDREAMVAVAFFGEGRPITGGLVPEGMLGYHPDLEGTYTYDPERAKELLAEAGYPDGFKMTIMSSGEHDMHQSTGEVALQNLQAIGIDAELELVDWNTAVERYARSEFHCRVHGSGTGGGDTDFMSDYYHSRFNHAPLANFADPEVDRLLDEARQVLDEEEREALYHEVQELLVDLTPHALLTYRFSGDAVRNEVVGWENYLGGLNLYGRKSIEKIRLNGAS